MNLFHHVYMFASSACGTKTGFLPSLYDNLPCDGNGGVTPTSLNDFLVVLANGVRILMAAAGALAVIFIIVGGIFYVASAGDPGRIKRAKEIITQAITGLIVVGISYTIVTYISSAF